MVDDTNQHELENKSTLINDVADDAAQSDPVDNSVAQNDPVTDDSATQVDPTLRDDNSDTVDQISPAADEPKESLADEEAAFEGEGAEVSIPEPEVNSEKSELSELSESETEVNADTADADVAEEAADSETSELSEKSEQSENKDSDDSASSDNSDHSDSPITPVNDNPNAKWYVVHTFSGHENKVATNLRQRIESEHLENRIIDILVPTQDKIEIRGGKKEQVKEKIFPGYILVKMDLDDASWLAVRTTQGVTAFVGMNNKPTPISEREVASIVKFMTQGAPATFKDVFMVDDTVRIVDGPFTDFIGKVESVDKEKGKVRILVSIFGRETPVELDFLQVTKL